jgi:uncharacterized FAD-dependent dehydrogenase
MKGYRKYFGKKIVMAIGRKGADFLSEICIKHNIITDIGSVDIGVRYELSNDVMERINKLLYEGKFIGKTSTYGDKVRTFCQNPSGFVSAEVYKNNLTLVLPERKYCTDNAAMIAAAGYYGYLQGDFAKADLNAVANLSL